MTDTQQVQATRDHNNIRRGEVVTIRGDDVDAATKGNDRWARPYEVGKRARDLTQAEKKAGEVQTTEAPPAMQKSA